LAFGRPCCRRRRVVVRIVGRWQARLPTSVVMASMAMVSMAMASMAMASMGMPSVGMPSVGMPSVGMPSIVGQAWQMRSVADENRG